MTSIYLLTFDGFAEHKESLLRFLDSRPQITDWHTSMSNTVIVVTELRVGELCDLLREGPVGSFIVVELRPEGYDKTIGGWLPRATWEFIDRKAAERKTAELKASVV